MTDIRAIAIMLNQEMAFLGDLAEVQMEMIDMGSEPNDCTADTMEEAAIKIINNASALYEALYRKAAE